MQQSPAKDNRPTEKIEKAARGKKLTGKVILIVGGVNGRQLIPYLAAQGADLALVYPPNAAIQADHMQKLVQAQGQRCLLIAADPLMTPQTIVRYVLSKMSSLDVFLDLTDLEEREEWSADTSAPHPRQPVAWSMLLAAVQHMAGVITQRQERGRLVTQGDKIMLFLGKDLIGNQVISVQDGRILGHVKDLYLDEGLERLTGVDLGGEGFLNRQYRFVERNHITTLGKDSVLILDGESIKTDENPAGLFHWQRRDGLHGRAVSTAGGTKIGVLDDVVLTAHGLITGFALGRIQVEGPIAEKKAIVRQAVLDIGADDDALIIDLVVAEAQPLTVVDAPLFSTEKTVTRDPETAVSTPVTPYTAQKAREEYVDHAAASPYVGDAQQAANHSATSPYIGRKVTEQAEEEFKSPYTTPEHV